MGSAWTGSNHDYPHAAAVAAAVVVAGRRGWAGGGTAVRPIRMQRGTWLQDRGGTMRARRHQM